MRSLTMIGVAASACLLAVAGCSSAPDPRSGRGPDQIVQVNSAS